jgi:DNA-binding NtrC family response regulator
MDALMRYPWPGNVRELENEVRRLAILTRGEVIGRELLSGHIRDGMVLRPGAIGDPAAVSRPVRRLAEVEREAILDAMRVFGDHRGKAAGALGISRSTLYLKLKEIGAAG